jgi:S-adenosylmethionine:tRNA ribosyltransferase-isomerase
MRRQDFYFDLPEALIAQYPLKNRTDSRLLVYQRECPGYQHRVFSEISAYLRPHDLVIMNNSKVIPARLYGQKLSGGKIECLIERIEDERHFWAHIKASKSPKPQTRIKLSEADEITVLEKQGHLYRCEANQAILPLLEKLGHMPLPPYIKREDALEDKARYQTVYAQVPGSVAAPTAGLHFDEVIIQKLQSQGVNFAYTTLHVGAGTFQPVRADSIFDHTMHYEYISVDERVCEAISKAKAAGGRVICVGTTSLRAIESASQSGEIKPFCGETNIFIYPGYHFKTVQGLITNFHLPESTLIMLVAAFIGYDETMALYQEAIKNQYRFFSYGDASLLL